VEVNTAEPGVFKIHEIGLVFADGSGAGALQTFLVDAAPMKVEGEETVLVFRGPTAALVNHQAAMGVTTTERICATARVARIGPLLAGVPMIMIGGLVDEPVAERGEMLAIHAFVICARNTLPKMTDDRVDEEQLAVLIPIVPPGICAALADKLEDSP